MSTIFNSLVSGCKRPATFLQIEEATGSFLVFLCAEDRFPSPWRKFVPGMVSSFLADVVLIFLVLLGLSWARLEEAKA